MTTRTHAAPELERTRVAREIGARLRDLRNAAGLSQRELADKAQAHLPAWTAEDTRRRGSSYAYISRIESGDRMPSIRALRALAAALGVSAKYLETGRRDISWGVAFEGAVLSGLTLTLDTDDEVLATEIEEIALAHGIQLQRLHPPAGEAETR